MNREILLQHLDEEIERLQKAKAILEGYEGRTIVSKKRQGTRTMSTEVRARIAAGQRARWARVKAGQKRK